MATTSNLPGPASNQLCEAKPNLCTSATSRVNSGHVIYLDSGQLVQKVQRMFCTHTGGPTLDLFARVSETHTETCLPACLSNKSVQVFTDNTPTANYSNFKNAGGRHSESLPPLITSRRVCHENERARPCCSASLLGYLHIYGKMVLSVR